MTNKTLQEQIEELEEKAKSTYLGNAFDIASKRTAQEALSIIKQLQEKNKKIKEVVYSTSLLSSYFPKLKQELYNEEDAKKVGVSEMIRGHDMQLHIMRLIYESKRILNNE